MTDAADLFCAPGRNCRPKRVAVVLRGLPGSGKTHIAKKLRELEVENGGEPPRIHAIDDYFMTVRLCL
jgi:YLP motif-containing protein 1